MIELLDKWRKEKLYEKTHEWMENNNIYIF